MPLYISLFICRCNENAEDATDAGIIIKVEQPTNSTMPEEACSDPETSSSVTNSSSEIVTRDFSKERKLIRCLIQFTESKKSGTYFKENEVFIKQCAEIFSSYDSVKQSFASLADDLKSQLTTFIDTMVETGKICQEDRVLEQQWREIFNSQAAVNKSSLPENVEVLSTNIDTLPELKVVLHDLKCENLEVTTSESDDCLNKDDDGTEIDEAVERDDTDEDSDDDSASGDDNDDSEHQCEDNVKVDKKENEDCSTANDPGSEIDDETVEGDDAYDDGSSSCDDNNESDHDDKDNAEIKKDKNDGCSKTADHGSKIDDETVEKDSDDDDDDSASDEDSDHQYEGNVMIKTSKSDSYLNKDNDGTQMSDESVERDGVDDGDDSASCDDNDSSDHDEEDNTKIQRNENDNCLNKDDPGSETDDETVEGDDSDDYFDNDSDDDEDSASGDDNDDSEHQHKKNVKIKKNEKDKCLNEDDDGAEIDDEAIEGDDADDDDDDYDWSSIDDDYDSASSDSTTVERNIKNSGWANPVLFDDQSEKKVKDSWWKPSMVRVEN